MNKLKAYCKRWQDERRIRVLNKYSLLFQALLSCVLVLVIETASRHSLSSALGFVVNSPLTFLYNVLLIFDTLLIVYLFKRRMLVRLIISMFWLVLGVANGVILGARVTPFNFTDLKLIGDLLDMKNSKYLSVGEEIVVLIFLAMVGLCLIYIAWKGPQFKGRMHRIRNAAACVVCIACLPFITKAAIHSNVLSGYFGNLAQGYREYGFVYSFTSSAVDIGMSKPDDYSEERVTQIHNEIQVEDTDAADKPNVIFIQLETFIDPYELNFLEYSEDPTPNFHKLMEEYSSGYLTVPVVGAGTANTEFEVLTGMGIQFFGLGEYPYKTILKEASCESAATAWKENGYHASALHNNGGNFYGRKRVFSHMGFDTFVSKEMMNITEFNELGSWPKDDILVQETGKILDSTEDQPDFLYTITVQSHGSYPEYQVFENPAIQVTGGATPEINYQWEYYINELHEVDQYIAHLIEYLESRDEKTVVVMYGDHLPTMGLENSDMRNGDIFKTTYTTWNNCGMEKEDADLYAYQIMAVMMDRLGFHDGNMFAFHQSAMNHGLDHTDLYLKDWENLQYDMLYGDYYTYGGELPYEPTEIEMGTADVVIDHFCISDDGETLEIYGSNFTPWSKVFVDEEKIPTVYVSDTKLEISLLDLEDGAVFVVNQMGSSSSIFRTSNQVTFYASPDFEEETKDAPEVEDTTEQDFIEPVEEPEEQ